MSQINEIKCPACGQWGQWTGKIDEKCEHCGGLLNPERFLYVEESRINEENQKKNDYFLVKDSDETIVQLFKIFLNPVRWGAFYGGAFVFILVAIMLVVFGMFI
jgi:hypothetical protein